MVINDLPDNVQLTKIADNWGGVDRRVEILRGAAVSHTLEDSRFWTNGGALSGGYRWEEVPRVVLADDQGQLELVVEAYKKGLAPELVNLYAYKGEERRARAVLHRIGYY